MANQLGAIKHVVQLMLENRSFDQMLGFVIDFKAAIASDLAKGFKDTLTGTQASEIMGMYSPDALPIMSALAKGYAVCDQWFCSAPTQTLPNRGFAAAATSLGFLQN